MRGYFRPLDDINGTLMLPSSRAFKIPIKFLDIEEDLFELPQKVRSPQVVYKSVIH